jgi:dipeptidyl aminopeptidase/acylaminoacyl peptidase
MVLLAAVGVLTGLRLQGNYLEVGINPEKIKVVNTKIISVPWEGDGFRFKGWSPDGEYFAVARRDRFYGDDARNKLRVDETMVFTKEGELHKKYSGAAIKWSPDSNSILLIFGDDEFRLQNIKTGHLVKFQPNFIGTYDAYRESFVVDFVPSTGNLIYYRLNDIFEYDFKTNKSSLIYTAPGRWLYNLKFIFDTLIFRLKKEDEYLLYKYHFKNKTLNKIFPHGISKAYYFMSKSNRLIIYLYSGVNEYSYFIDKEGKILLKIKGFIFDSPENRSDEFVNFDFTSFAPNGKLFAATIGQFTEVYDEVITADVYLFNLSGKIVKLTKTDDRMELVCGWSPQGNKLIYFENKEKKYYLLTLTVDK